MCAERDACADPVEAPYLSLDAFEMARIEPLGQQRGNAIRHHVGSFQRVRILARKGARAPRARG